MILRPQRAIVRDGFREAIASRTLWVSLILCTVFLGLLAPLSYTRRLTTSLDTDRPEEFLTTLAAAALDEPKAGPGRPVAERIVDRLGPEGRTVLAGYRDRIKRIDPKRPPFEQVTARIEAAGQAFGRIGRELPAVVSAPDFYDKEAFAGVSLSQETKELLKVPAETRTDVQASRLGRLLLEDAFPSAYRRSPPESYILTYLGYELIFPIQETEEQFVERVGGYGRAAVNWIVGFGGILLALLVTAPIMPQTFDPNSLLLLLSKPVSRVSLYISQFVGGCAFVVCLVTFLVLGLVGLLGVRFGVWQPGLLWWIPAFTFVFSIYYSVSALIGVLTRSAIFAFLVSVFLWSFCTILGLVQSATELFGIDRTAVYRIEPAGVDVVARTGNSFWARFSRFDPADEQWKEVDLASGQGRQSGPFTPIQFGPVYDPTNRVVVAQIGLAGTGSDSQLSVVVPELGFERRPGPSLQGDPEAIVSLSGDVPADEPAGGGLMIVTSTSVGLQRGKLQALPTETDAANPLAGLPAINLNPFKLFGRGEKKPVKDTAEEDRPYVDLTPRPWGYRDGSSVAYHPGAGVLLLLTEGELTAFARVPGRPFEPVATRAVEGAKGRGTVLAAGGPPDRPVVAVAIEDGTVVVARLTVGDGTTDKPAPVTIEEVARARPAGGTTPESVAVAPDGETVAVLSAGRRVYLVDVEGGRSRGAGLFWQGTFTAIRFWPDGTLAVADRSGGVGWYDVATWAETRRLRPSTTFFYRFYFYFVEPAYLLLPKPGELDQTVHYLMTGDETRRPTVWETALSGVLPQGMGLGGGRVRLDPWAPVWSGGLFLAVMLGLGSAWMWWKEF